MSAGDLGRELEVAIRLARQAGRTIMGYYRTGLSVEHKAGGEPLTAADLAADDLIRSGLREAFPGDGLFSEESPDDLSRLEKERVWIVDPLDGTTDFVDENDEFAVQIALTVAGRPVLGVVLQPTTGQLYYASEAQGACRVSGGTTTRLHVSTVSEPSRMRLVASRSHYSQLVKDARRRLGIRSVQRVGSVGLKVGRVAQGECDLYLATFVSKEWDICGGALVYNKADVMACRGLIGSNGLAHDRIVETVAALRPLSGE